MKDKHSTYRLEEITDAIIDCPHSTPLWTETGFIVLRNQNIRNGRLNLNNPSFTNKEGFQNRIKRAIPQYNDLVFTREAPMGEVCLIPKNLTCCLGQRMVLIRPNQKHVNSRFLLYQFQSRSVQHQISWNEGTGTTVSNVRIPNIKSLEFNLPPLPEQKAIAHILGTLDDKIELNRKMNETLEEMAQALFKSWFVDFDPVLDKALATGNEIPEPLLKKAQKRKGVPNYKKLIHSNPELVEGFPDSFVFTEELGWIPEGWEVKELSDLSDSIIDCLHSKKPDRLEDGKLMLQVYNIGGSGRLVWKDKYLISNIDHENWTKRITPQYGDIFITKTGRVGATGQLLEKLDLSFGRNIVVLRPSSAFPKFLMGVAMRSDHMKKEIGLNTSDGTILRSLHVKHVSRLRLVHPKDNKIISSIESIIEPWITKISIGDQQIERLEDLRDTLLPKLISGDLRVPEAEKLVAQHV